MISPKHSLSAEVTKLQRPVSCLYVKNCRPENQWIQRMHDNRHLLATPCAICTGLSTTQASSVVCWVASVVSNSFWPSRLSPPGSSVHGICQARILEWLAMPSSRGVFSTQGSNQHLLCLLHWQAGSLLPGITVHGILQAKILEWIAFPVSRGSSRPRDWTQVSHIASEFFTTWAIREAQEY